RPSGEGPTSWEVMYEAIETPDFLKMLPFSTEDGRPAPTVEAQRALDEMTGAASHVVAAGEAYQGVVQAISKRSLRRRIRDRMRYFDRKLDQEHVALEWSRDQAIARLEHFIARYPKDPKYTPDTMFRLGELY